METLYPRCCGRDIHKRDLVACLITAGTDGRPTKVIRKFGNPLPGDERTAARPSFSFVVRPALRVRDRTDVFHHPHPVADAPTGQAV
jgi:hypothetical protein